MKKAAILLVLLMPSCAFASDRETALAMQTTCKAVDSKPINLYEATDFGECLGYLRGFVDGALLKPGLCLPDEPLQAGQLQQIFMKFLRDHPEKLNRSTGSAVMLALYAAFPCPAK